MFGPRTIHIRSVYVIFSRDLVFNVWSGLFNNTLLSLNIFNGTLNAGICHEFSVKIVGFFGRYSTSSKTTYMRKQHDGAPLRRERPVTQPRKFSSSLEVMCSSGGTII